MSTPPTERNPDQRQQDVQQPTSEEPKGRFEPKLREVGGGEAVAGGSVVLHRPQLTGGRLPDQAAWMVLAGVGAVVLLVLLAALGFNAALFVLATGVISAIVVYAWSRVVEGSRKAVDRLMTLLVSAAFALACVPLVSLLYTVISRGLHRFDSAFFTETARGAIGGGGGAQHAIVGTLIITGVTTIISVPIGIMAAVYLQEYGTGRLRRALTFFVDVMTGIPSIVAGLFAYALFALFLGPGIRLGIMGSVALSVLMIPIVVRATEEMLRIVPNNLREASYALGVPKWRTITKVVLPTALAGIVTGVMLAVARIVGETAPLLITTGVVSSMNTNPFDGRMQNLAVYAFNSYKTPGVPAQNGYDRAWAAALTLILIVMILNLAARLIYRRFGTEIR
jgi:phosphate transport system permease protein